ncbi:hypothetical protein [Streptomyces hydrogenans]|nr:hypothetical protein [Streptomyces hydrogenans]
MIVGRPFGSRCAQAAPEHDAAVVPHPATASGGITSAQGNANQMVGGTTFHMQYPGLETGFNSSVSRLRYFNNGHLYPHTESLDRESTQKRDLPANWVEIMDKLEPADRAKFAEWLSVLSSPHPEKTIHGSTQEQQLPANWDDFIGKLEPADRAKFEGWLSLLPSSHPEGMDHESAQAFQFSPDWFSRRDRIALRLAKSIFRFRGTHPYIYHPSYLGQAGKIFEGMHASSGPELSRAELANVASSSEGSIDHALAMMFIRLGPPPEPTEVDYAPASNGGGGAQQ